MDIDNDTDRRLYTRDGLPVAKSVQGYVIIALNIHEEATEDEVTDFFSEYGKVRSLHLNMDRQTGYVKGCALVEYKERFEAEDAVLNADGAEFMDQTIRVDYAFVDVPVESEKKGRADKTRTRDRSPVRVRS